MMSSSDGVLTALKLDHPMIKRHSLISTNHFDIDSFISVWCFLNPEVALRYEKILREVARIGDFRELRLDEAYQYDALKLCCWLNTIERQEFYAPFGSAMEKDDSVAKFEYFLPRFQRVLENPSEYKKWWEEEFKRASSDYATLNSPSKNKNVQVDRFESIDLVMVTCPEPLHYYALFSVGRGYDIVVAIYEDQRYEIEVKYTTYVTIHRPVLPRMNLQSLTRVLNSHETVPDHTWHASSFTDSGPLLRLDPMESGKVKTLNKEMRYGHPYERPIYKSGIAKGVFRTVVLTFFRWCYSTNHGLRDAPKPTSHSNPLPKGEESEDKSLPFSESKSQTISLAVPEGSTRTGDPPMPTANRRIIISSNSISKRKQEKFQLHPTPSRIESPSPVADVKRRRNHLAFSRSMSSGLLGAKYSSPPAPPNVESQKATESDCEQDPDEDLSRLTERELSEFSISGLGEDVDLDEDVDVEVNEDDVDDSLLPEDGEEDMAGEIFKDYNRKRPSESTVKDKLEKVTTAEGERKKAKVSLWRFLQMGEFVATERKREWTWGELRRINKYVDTASWEQGFSSIPDLESLLAPLSSPSLPSSSSYSPPRSTPSHFDMEEKLKKGSSSTDFSPSLPPLASTSKVPPPPALLGETTGLTVDGIPPPPPPPPSMMGMGFGRGEAKLKRKTGQVPPVELKRIHWVPIDIDTGNTPVKKGSIWASMRTDINVDVARLAMMFSTKKNAKRSRRKKSRQSSICGLGSGGSEARISLLDSKREMNISITLSGMRMSPEEVSEAIFNIDLAALTPDRLPQIKIALPSPDEAKEAGKYIGEPCRLTTASRLHYLLLSQCPENSGKSVEAQRPLGDLELERRRKKIVGAVEYMLFMHTVPDTLKKIHSELLFLSKATTALTDSKKIYRVAETVLTIGNFMNFSAGSRSCYAFGVESLSKLAVSKANDRKTSLLDFVAYTCLKNFPEDFEAHGSRKRAEFLTEKVASFTLGSEMRYVVRASKIDSDHVVQELSRTKSQLRQLGAWLRAAAQADREDYVVGLWAVSHFSSCFLTRVSGLGMVGRTNTEQDAYSAIGVRFYQVLSNRFMKCAKLHDKLQKSYKVILARFNSLVRRWGENPSRFEALEDFLRIFAEFSTMWDAAVVRSNCLDCI
ncbi:hypothetical protein AAMO2058_000088400 [Amorphochlora amoebiformis]